MKLLEKRQIDKSKAIERKIEVDSGINLAKKIDTLRETSLKEEKQLYEWRASSIKKVQYEIDQFIEERDNLEKQNNEARTLRNNLLKPLDNEWIEVSKVKIQIGLDKCVIEEDRKLLDVDIEDIKQNKLKISQIVVKSKQNEIETEKVKSETISLKDLAQREYDIIREEHNEQTERYENKIFELSQREKEYEVAISIIKIRENEVKEKESELLKDKAHLESQQAQLRRVIEINNVSNNTTNK